MIPVSLRHEDSEILEANCTITKDYQIISGDESFYRMMGENTMFLMNKLIYPDDLNIFEECIFSDKSNFVLLRIHTAKEVFRWVLMRRRFEADEPGRIELQIKDVITQNDKFELYYNNVRKYRVFMNQMKQRFFEYDFKTKIITIYFYVNGHSEILEKDMLSEWQKRVVRMGFVEGENIERFNRMCDDIENGIDSFSSTFQSSFMSRGTRTDLLNFRGETMREGSINMLVVGLIDEIGGRIDAQPVLYDNDVNKDSATGLLNKKAVTEAVIDALAEADTLNDRRTLYLAVMDIDDFKNVNDTYGHYFGDEVIAGFAAELRKNIGDKGIIGRIGGDEFICLFTDCYSEDDVRIYLKAIRKGLSFSLAEKQPGYEFGASIGAAKYPQDGTVYEELFRIADGCLYIAKEKGKNRYIIYDEKLHGKAIAEGIKNGHIIGGDFMKPYEKGNMTADMIARIVKDGRNAIDSVFTELMDKMHIQGICVYAGDDMACVKKYGKYGNHPQYAALMGNDKYLSLFNENGINVINNITSLAMDFYDIYKMLIEEKICSSLQIGVKDADGVYKWLICFDTFGDHKRKWSHDDIMSIYILIKTIAKLDEINDEKNL